MDSGTPKCERLLLEDAHDLVRTDEYLDRVVKTPILELAGFFLVVLRNRLFGHSGWQAANTRLDILNFLAGL